MMQDQVYARALMLAGELDAAQQEVLRVLCEAAFSTLEARLREGMAAEDCREPFVTAAAFQALAALEDFASDVREFKAGDLTVKTGGNGRKALLYQADTLMRPYLKDTFLFTGV